jgi:hypothetical protein
MQSNLFDRAAEQLELSSDLDRLEARGTLRLAVKEAGLNFKALSILELGVVFEKIMPAELKLRGIDKAEEICSTLFKNLEATASGSEEAASSSVDDVFSRLGGDL